MGSYDSAWFAKNWMPAFLRASCFRASRMDEPFAKFASRWDLLPGRVVIPGSAGVPPAQDLAGSWRLASQGWSVHLPTGAGAAPLQECGRDARAPRGKPMAGQVQIRILQKARMFYLSRVQVRSATLLCWWETVSSGSDTHTSKGVDGATGVRGPEGGRSPTGGERTPVKLARLLGCSELANPHLG